MPIVPPPPAGSRIEILETAEGVEVRMPPHGLFVRCFEATICLVVGVAFLLHAVHGASLLATAVPAAIGVHDVFFILVALAWLALSAGGGAALVRLAHRRLLGGPERIVLSAERLDFDPGGMGGHQHVAPCELLEQEVGELGWKSQGAWPRTEIDLIVALADDQGGCVAVRRGKEGVVFGGRLGRPERTWLCDVLQQWRDGNPA